MNQLYKEIKRLHRANAIHIRKGFRLLDATIADCTNHLLEETVEAQAEIICKRAFYGVSSASIDHGNEQSQKDIIEELGDVRLVYLDLLIRLRLTEKQVDDVALIKLGKSFTADPQEVTAIKNGVTIKGRSK